MKCARCGNENKDQARFCSACGSPLLTRKPETAQGKKHLPRRAVVGIVAGAAVLACAIAAFVAWSLHAAWQQEHRLYDVELAVQAKG